MNWRTFFAVIAIGLTAIAYIAFIAFLASIGTLPLPTALWGTGISVVIALVGTATLYGMEDAK
jgi:hypothetical protein